MTAAMLDDPEGRALVAAIHERKRRNTMSDYSEHLISMAGGDVEAVDRIKRRDIEDMEDFIDGGIMRTLSGKRIARILSKNGFGQTRALLALVREQAAKLDLIANQANAAELLCRANGWDPELATVPAGAMRAALTATETGPKQAYIVECEDLGPGDQVWFPSLFDAEQTCGPFPSCCKPKPVGDDYDGPKWVAE